MKTKRVTKIAQDAEDNSVLALYVVCSYCRKIIDVKEAHIDQIGKITHSICEECMEKEIERIRKKALEKQNGQIRNNDKN